MPVFKVPFHFSYLLYLARFSEALMVAYLRTALAFCRVTGTRAVVPAASARPARRRPGAGAGVLPRHGHAERAQDGSCSQRVLTMLGEHFELVNMSAHARRIEARGRLPVRAVA